MLALLSVLTLAAAAPAAADPNLAVRACPQGSVWTYPVEDMRGVQGLMLQDFAIVNRAGVDFTPTSVEIELLSAGEVRDTRRIDQAYLAKAAASAPQIAAFAAALPSQFCDGRLLDGARLASSPALKANEGVVVLHQSFIWSGPRDTVRIVARGTRDGREATASTEIPIRSGASKTAFRFPLSGTWYVGAGPTLHSHHRWAAMEEFAYDLMKVDGNGATHTGDGSKFSDYYAYGAPVLAAAAGTVVKAVDGVAEDPTAMRRPDETKEAYFGRLQQEQGARLAEGERGLTGNQVVIDHGNGEYSIYVHLKPGSVLVKPGQTVAAGQPIAALGSSGNSTEPHLHFQVCDRPEVVSCAAIPPRFGDFDLPLADLPRPLQTGDFVTAK